MFGAVDETTNLGRRCAAGVGLSYRGRDCVRPAIGSGPALPPISAIPSAGTNGPPKTVTWTPSFCSPRSTSAGLKGDKDIAEAIRWYGVAAAQGHVPSQLRLARLYYAGRVVERDLFKAATWYGEAAEAGHAQAQYNYALMLQRGQGVTRDAAKAAAWYGKAAEAGIADAQRNFGLLLARGDGVAKDSVKALTWLEIAAGNKAPVPDVVLNALTKDLTDDQKQAAKLAAADWLRRNSIK